MHEYIARDWLLREYDRQHKGVPGKARKIMETAPAADVVSRDCYNRLLAENDELRKVRPVVHGHYIGEYDGYADGNPVYDMWYCSECGCFFEDWDEKPTYNFCPNCGARMDGDVDA